jgi:predicted methyltransferase
MDTKLDGASIARVSLHDPSHFSIQYSQTLHRLVLLQHWDIAPNSKVVELGCGQGDCTTVLATAVGEQGKVVAVDPAELDYGACFQVSIRRLSLLSGPLTLLSRMGQRTATGG